MASFDDKFNVGMLILLAITILLISRPVITYILGFIVVALLTIGITYGLGAIWYFVFP